MNSYVIHYYDADMTNGKTYTYKVRFYRKNGTYVTKTAMYKYLDPVTDLKASGAGGTSGKLKVSWTKNKKADYTAVFVRDITTGREAVRFKLTTGSSVSAIGKLVKGHMYKVTAICSKNEYTYTSREQIKFFTAK